MLWTQSGDVVEIRKELLSTAKVLISEIDHAAPNVKKRFTSLVLEIAKEMMNARPDVASGKGKLAERDAKVDKLNRNLLLMVKNSAKAASLKPLLAARDVKLTVMHVVAFAMTKPLEAMTRRHAELS